MKIDAIVTEYGRPELLVRLMKSLRLSDFNRVIVHRDGMSCDTSGIGNYTTLCSEERVGQVLALDKLMGEVGTEFYVNLEEDLEPVGSYMEGILEAIEILKTNPMCGSVSLRGNDKKAHNGHPSELVDDVWRLQNGWAGWSGFSYAPSVRRLAQYKEIGSYSSIAIFDKKRPWEAERTIGNWYAEKGYWFATTEKQYFVHNDGGNSTFGK